jgi:hypothetical protein
LTFPWVASADALHIEFSPIDRLISVLILLYVSISLMSVIVHWHVAYEMIRSLLPKQFAQKANAKKSGKAGPWIALSMFGGSLLLMESTLREDDIFRVGELWLSIRFPSEVMLVLILFILARRRRKAR